ncbi:MAG: hypothetical protein CL916_02885, partial [Deltaproteobacteria bacterium]|nr:hypothetical protein [Deltaproteobacteria bacterium]
VPPLPQEKIAKEDLKSETNEDTSEEVTPSPKPDHIGPIIDTSPINAPMDHKASILVSHITSIQQSNQEINCLLLCQQSVMDTSIAQGSYHIRDCSEQRVDNWSELVQKGESTTPVGEVSCVLVPKIHRRVIKGRAPLSSSANLQIVTSLASHFARQAQEEAISIFSFAELHQILCVYNAPKNLQERCIRSLKEEQAHTRMAITLCERYGGSSPDMHVPSPKTVSLFDAALHNAIVGCIQETWAAVLEEYQAQHTQIHQHIQRRIAKDEASHAQLAWDIHDFFMDLLSQNERSHIIEQMTSLLSSYDIDVIESFPRSKEIGIPSIEIQTRLYNKFSNLIQQRIRQAA